MSEKNMTIKDGGEYTSVIPEGELTNENVKDLVAAFDRVMHDKKGDVVLDLIHVDYLYSLPINIIFRYYRLFAAEERELAVVNASGLVKDVLTSVNLNKVIPVFYNIDEVLRWRSRKSKKTDIMSHLTLVKQPGAGELRVELRRKEFADRDGNIRQEIESLLEEAEDNRITMDLNGAGLLETASIASILKLARELKKKGGVLTITGAGPDSKSLLKLLDIDRNFSYDDEPRSGEGDE